LFRAEVRSGLAAEGGVSGDASPAAVGGEEEAWREESWNRGSSWVRCGSLLLGLEQIGDFDGVA
jgi:hypothetical protein